MSRKFQKKNIKKMKEEKESKTKKKKLPYYPPTHKDLDLERDIDDIIYNPINVEEKKVGWIKKISNKYKRFKYHFMKKYNIQEIYVDIMFFFFEILMAILIIYFIMIFVIHFKSRIR